MALFCLQFAVAMGVEVWVTSSSTDKIKRAVQLGAAGGVSYRDKDWKAQLRRAVPDGFDAVVDGALGTCHRQGCQGEGVQQLTCETHAGALHSTLQVLVVTA